MSNKRDRNNSIFQNNTSIVTFNEFRYFTSLNKINSSFFNGCTSLKEIELPIGIKELGGYVFSGCTSLERLVIPEGYESISNRNICANCTSLKLFDLPKTMKDIYDGALWGLSGKVIVICRAVTPPTLGTLNANPLALYVPDESLSAYQAARGWSQYAKFMKPLSEYAG